jgi:hypothetical protein
MQNKSELDKVERKGWLNWKCFIKSNLLKLTWLQLWDVDIFISFPKSPRSSKSEFGAKSYAHNTKSELLKKTRAAYGMFGAHWTVRCAKVSQTCMASTLGCREFHKLSKSTRSSKSEFGAKSYGQNTTSEHGLSGAHRTVRCAIFGSSNDYF